MKYTILYENGEKSIFVDQEEWPLKKLQDAVGGFIEMVPSVFWNADIPKDAEVYCNEEGKLLELKPNVQMKHFVIDYITTDYIAGPVVVEEHESPREAVKAMMRESEDLYA